MQISSEYRVFLAAQTLSKPESSKYMLSIHPFKIIFAFNYIVWPPLPCWGSEGTFSQLTWVSYNPSSTGHRAVWDVLGCTHEWKQAHHFDALSPGVWWSFTSSNGEVPSFISALKFYKIKIILGFPWWSSVLPMQGAQVRSLVRELDPTSPN